MMGRRTALFTYPAALFFALAQPLAAQDNGELPVEDIVRNRVETLISDQSMLPSDMNIEIDLPPGSPAYGRNLDRFQYDAKSGRFSTLMESSGSTIALHGRAQITVPALIPIRRIEAGETISAGDLESVQIPLSAAKVNVLRRAENIVGFEAKRSLLPERPILDQSLIAPRAVHRGKAVTISLSEDGLSLLAPGKALEDGAPGDMVRVVNTHSNSIIYAEVSGPDQVRVTTTKQKR